MACGYEKDEICLILDRLLSTVDFSIEDKELAYAQFCSKTGKDFGRGDTTKSIKSDGLARESPAEAMASIMNPR